MDVYWEPNPGPQTEVLTRLEDEVLYGGARGGGKTEAGLVWMIEPDYVKNPLYRGLVIRKNSDDLSDWIARAAEMYRPLRARITGNPPIIRFPSGAFIRTGHLKDESAYEKYQGHEYQKILLEELTQIPNQERYLRLIASCRTTVPELKAQVFNTANPGGSGHGWVKKRFVDVATNKTFFETGRVAGKTVRKSRIFIPSRVEDTPQLLLNNPEYILFLDSLSEDTRRAWREGDWTVFVGQFFSEFRQDVHVIEPFKVPDDWEKIFAVDWGYDPHPFHVGWYAISPQKRIVKYRELQNTEYSPIQLAESILELSEHDKNLLYGVGDTQMWQDNPFARQKPDYYSHPERSIAVQINTVLAEKDLHMQQANKARETGWVNLKTLLKWTGERTVQGIEFEKEPLFQIFLTCTETIKAYPIQVHDEKKPGDMLKQDGDDPCDTDRYAIMGMWDRYDMPKVITHHQMVTPQEKTIWQKAYEVEYPDVVWAEQEEERESLY